MSEEFVAALFERDRSILSAFLERWRPLGMTIKERLPAQVETVADLLKCLTVERQPFLPRGLAESGKMALELCLWQRLAEQPIVAPMERHRVIPCASGDIDRAIQMPIALVLVELESEGLTHAVSFSRKLLMAQGYRHFNTSVCLINYHFVWIPKRRKAVLVGAIERDLRRFLESKAQELDSIIVALEIMPDHVHLFLNCPPVLAPDQIMFRLKGSSSRLLRERYPQLLRLPSLWTRSYFCSTAGNVSNATIERYIAEQKHHE
jgi:putative transposase